MAGAQFEYDEKGTTFYYFLLSFFGIVLVPLTYYVWKVTKLPGKFEIVCVSYSEGGVKISSGRLGSLTIWPSSTLYLLFFYILTHVLLTPISEDQKETVKVCRCPPCVEKRESLRKKEPKSKSIRYVR